MLFCNLFIGRPSYNNKLKRITVFNNALTHTSDRQTERPWQYRALHYMQSRSKKSADPNTAD